MNSKLTTMTASLLAATIALAAPTKKPRVVMAEDDEPTTGKEAKVTIEQFPKMGKMCQLPAPSLSGGSIIGPNVYGKATSRKWIVLETKYQTFVKWQDQLTFTWHVLLETKTATENKGNRDLAPYSYFTTSVTYMNIPMGTHAACVCLHPSNLERFGEPKAVGLVITNGRGEVLAGDCESEVKGIPTHPKDLQAAFWNDQKIMNATNAEGKPMIERRQGLQDRSKTIWALVNPNDYELVAQ